VTDEETRVLEREADAGDDAALERLLETRLAPGRFWRTLIGSDSPSSGAGPAMWIRVHVLAAL